MTTSKSSVSLLAAVSMAAVHRRAILPRFLWITLLMHGTRAMLRWHRGITKFLYRRFFRNKPRLRIYSSLSVCQRPTSDSRLCGWSHRYAMHQDRSMFLLFLNAVYDHGPFSRSYCCTQSCFIGPILRCWHFTHNIGRRRASVDPWMKKARYLDEFKYLCAWVDFLVGIGCLSK